MHLTDVGYRACRESDTTRPSEARRDQTGIHLSCKRRSRWVSSVPQPRDAFSMLQQVQHQGLSSECCLLSLALSIARAKDSALSASALSRDQHVSIAGREFLLPGHR